MLPFWSLFFKKFSRERKASANASPDFTNLAWLTRAFCRGSICPTSGRLCSKLRSRGDLLARALAMVPLGQERPLLCFCCLVLRVSVRQVPSKD